MYISPEQTSLYTSNGANTEALLGVYLVGRALDKVVASCTEATLWTDIKQPSNPINSSKRNVKTLVEEPVILLALPDPSHDDSHLGKRQQN